MFTSRLRRVGDSTLLAVPAEFLKMLHLQANDTVSVSVENGRLIVEPQSRSRYTLTELMADSAGAGLWATQDRVWLAAPAVGRELL
ncbi:MAG: antitoxin [Thermomicrobiales bacterium]